MTCAIYGGLAVLGVVAFVAWLMCGMQDDMRAAYDEDH